MQYATALFPAILVSTLLYSCNDSEAQSPSDGAGGASPDGAAAAECVATYAQIVAATYEDTVTAAQRLNVALQAFVDAPSATKLDDAREAWLGSRESYLQTEVFRFYGGPIDDADGPEGYLNAWPLDEAYIDSVASDPTGGLINDPSVELNEQSLLELNERGGEANIATGYHAIEFMLWGQDFSDDGAGARPYTDFVSGNEETAPNPDRRRQYLGLLGEILVEQLVGVLTEWVEDDDNYRTEFLLAPTDDALAKILTGMIILSGFETGGERLQAALDSGDQEDEHSCFSDNTHRDMIQDIQGILNVYLGSYVTTDGEHIVGTGVREVIAEHDGELAVELEDRIRESLRLANALERPFDQAIALDNEEGRAGVAELVVSLQEQEALLEEVFRALELEIPDIQ